MNKTKVGFHLLLTILSAVLSLLVLTAYEPKNILTKILCCTILVLSITSMKSSILYLVEEEDNE